MTVAIQCDKPQHSGGTARDKSIERAVNTAGGSGRAVSRRCDLSCTLKESRSKVKVKWGDRKGYSRWDKPLKQSHGGGKKARYILGTKMSSAEMWLDVCLRVLLQATYSGDSVEGSEEGAR